MRKRPINQNSVNIRTTDNLEDVAKAALIAVASDPIAPPAARAAAARTLAEMAGLIGRNQAPPPAHAGKAPHAMTRAEIDAEIARLAQETDEDPF
jgi:hypothetical protein